MNWTNLTQQAEGLAKQFMDNNWQLAVAESCTGGLISAVITELPGASNWFDRGFVTYSNKAKETILGIPARLIEAEGAVSEAVAIAMAEAVLKHSDSDFSLAVTGIAGPSGERPGKPVGTVFIAWASSNAQHCVCQRYQFDGGRHEIRMMTCQNALSGLYEFINT